MFGWNVQKEAEDIGLTQIHVSPTVEILVIPPWLFPMPIVDLQILEEKRLFPRIRLHKYIDQNYSQEIKIFAYGSKYPFSGKQQFLYTFLILKLELQKGQVIINQFTQQK